MDKQVQAAVDTLDKAFKIVMDERAKLGKLAAELGKRATKANVPAEFEVDGLVKGYMTFIKDSDGLASMSPSCSAALSAAEKSPSVKSLNAAAAALKKQADTVKAAAAKDAGADKGAVKKFLAGLANVIEQLDAAAEQIAKPAT